MADELELFLKLHKNKVFTVHNGEHIVGAALHDSQE